MVDENPQMRLPDEDAIQRTAEALNARNLETTVVGSGEEALRLLKDLVPDGAEIFNSTSETLDSIGFTEYLHNTTRYRDLHKALDAEPDLTRQREMRRMASIAEYVVGSVQAIAETGEVVIASASGSQMGAYAYGAKNLILVVGTQKICPTLDDAISRVRGYSQERHQEWQIGQGRQPRPMGKLMLLENEAPGRIKVILIKEKLGW